MQLLYQEILESQNGNKDKMLKMVNKFQPLILKNSKKLYYEDAYEDVQTRFIEIIQNIKLEKFKHVNDPYILKYLKISVQNSCIQLSKSRASFKTIPLFSYVDNTGDNFSSLWSNKNLSHIDEYPHIKLDILRKILTPYEYNIINFFYFQQFQVQEIAKYFHKSSSAISQAKKSALKKLKKNLTKESLFDV